MSMWCSARSDVRAAAQGPLVKVAMVVLAACLALAACSRGPGSEDQTGVRAKTEVTPKLRFDEVPEEEPGVARTRWRVANDVARSVTGNLQVSLVSARGGPLVFAFANGITTRAQPISVRPASDRSGVTGRNFAQVLGGDTRVPAHLYRVVDETVAATASNGGLCGPSRATHLVVSEFVDSRGRWVFKLASFRGEGPPGVSGVDPGFCATYAYESPS